VQTVIKTFNIYTDHRGTGNAYTMNVSSALHIAPFGLFHPSHLLSPISFEYSNNFHAVDGRVKYQEGTKRKFNATQDVQWITVDENDPDISYNHAPATPGTTPFDDYLGIDYVNQYSSEPWIADVKQSRKPNASPIVTHSSKRRRTSESKAGGRAAAANTEDMQVDDTAAATEKKEKTPKKKKKEKSLAVHLHIPPKFMDRRLPVPLPQAIVEAIEQVGSKSLRVQLYSNILVCGGTSLLTGFKGAMEDSIMSLLPREINSFEIYTGKDLNRDSANFAWQGAQILTKFCTPADWINKQNWCQHGIACFREKLQFSYDNNEHNKL